MADICSLGMTSQGDVLPSKQQYFLRMNQAHRTTVGLRRSDLVRVDQLIALLIFVQVELHVWHVTSGPARIWSTLAALIFSVPVALRRRWPLPGMLVIIGAVAIKTAVEHGSGALGGAAGVLPALLLMGYAVGAYPPPRQSRWVFGLTLAVAATNALVTPGKAATLPVSLVFVGVLPYVFGRMMRARSERASALRAEAERIDADRDALANAAASQERVRIARELHDVIAHSVSIMVVQAGGARMVMDAEPDRAMASLRSVERVGRDALTEMRRLLGILDGEGESRTLTPQPGLSDLEALLDHARAAGLETVARIHGQPVAVPPALDLCAYRVIQEALTNAIKHAAPGKSEIHLWWKPEALDLEISDDGGGQHPAGLASGGHGIIGMRERVSLHGGVVHAGVQPNGGYAVRASLPLSEPPLS
jgi:signal transduction histidine kinase